VQNLEGVSKSIVFSFFNDNPLIETIYESFNLARDPVLQGNVNMVLLKDIFTQENDYLSYLSRNSTADRTKQ